MASEARANICTAAVELFNEHGYSSVSLRQIAAHAGTTIGNLTYHFSRKDDLLRAILSDLHSVFSDKFESGLHGADLIERIVTLILLNEENERAYPFYFENIAEITRQSESLREEGSLFANKLCTYYAESLQTLKDDGWIRNDLSEDALGTLAYCIVQMESGWIEANAPYANELLPRISVSQAICHLVAAHMDGDHIDGYREICRSLGVEI